MQWGREKMEPGPGGHCAADGSNVQHDMRVEETRAACERMPRFAEDEKFKTPNDAKLFIDLPSFRRLLLFGKRNQHQSK